MGKLVMALCDADDGYRSRFVTYLIEHKSKEIMVHAFSAADAFLREVGTQKFDVALFGKGFEEAREQVLELGIPLLLLQETVPQMVKEGSDYQAGSACVDVFRYQPMEEILREVQVLAGTNQPVGTNQLAGEVPAALRMEVIGVYSPMRHEMQIPFAVTLAGLLAEKRKVLYINLIKYSGFLELFHLAGEYDLGDIVLRLRNKRLYPDTFLKSIYMVDQICYIPPFANPEDLCDFTIEDYLKLLAFLEDRTDFEAVIFDFGDGIGALAGMLAHCASIYCPMKTGHFFECQMEQFSDYLDKGDCGELRARLHRVNLPFSAKHIRGGDVYRQLLWSDFGDYVRDFLMGGDMFENFR